MTEPAQSVRFQAHSSVLAGSAPAANFKPTRPSTHTGNLTSSQPQQSQEKRSSTDIESKFSPMPAQRGGAEMEMGAGWNRRELDASLGVLCSGLMYGSVLFLELGSVVLPD